MTDKLTPAEVIRLGIGQKQPADAILAAMEAVGWVVVPVEPTQEMLVAGQGWDGMVGMYKRMLAARPK
jgi:hypothetical protein